MQSVPEKQNHWIMFALLLFTFYLLHSDLGIGSPLSRFLRLRRTVQSNKRKKRGGHGHDAAKRR